jgi:hypothetical protein
MTDATHAAIGLLQEYDARARAITVRATESLRLGVHTLGRQCVSYRHEVQIIRGASRERMRIRHAIKALRALQEVRTNLTDWRDDLAREPEYRTMEIGEIAWRLTYTLRDEPA